MVMLSRDTRKFHFLSASASRHKLSKSWFSSVRYESESGMQPRAIADFIGSSGPMALPSNA